MLKRHERVSHRNPFSSGSERLGTTTAFHSVEIALDMSDNQIDTLTKAFRSTVSCARCHDHRLDPVATQDYYGLYSILNSSQTVTHNIDLPQVSEEPTRRIVGTETLYPCGTGRHLD